MGKLKLLFIRSNQPIALEVLGYALCALIGSMIIFSDPQNWKNYFHAVIIVVALGCLYRIVVAYMDKVAAKIKKAYDVTTTFLARLAGKRGNLRPQEHTKYGVIGVSLFIPAIMSFFTFPYLLQIFMKMDVKTSYLVTIPLAFVIFIVDRAFVATMGWQKIWYGVIARITLAIAMGLFLSGPIVLQMFQQETTEELKVQKQEKLASIEKDRQAEFERINLKETNASMELNRARQEYEKEVNQSIGGRIAGHGIEAKKKLEYFEQQDNLFRNNIAPVIAQERATADALFNEKRKEYQETQSYGLGAREEALDAVAKKYPAVNKSLWLIIITLVMLDLSPLLAKLLMPKSQSDREEQKEEEAKENELQLAKVDHKYKLMEAELTAIQSMVDNMELNNEEKERAKKILRNKISRRYVSEEMFSNN